MPLPPCYYKILHSYHTSSSTHLGVPRLWPSISVWHTRSFSYLGVYFLRPIIKNAHPVLPFLSGSSSYCVPISPLILPPLASHESFRVAWSCFSVASWHHHASLLCPHLSYPVSFNTPQIREITPPTYPRFPVVALCRSFPNSFPLPLIRLLPTASPMSRLLTALLASSW